MTEPTQEMTIEQKQLARQSFYLAAHAKYMELISVLKDLPIIPQCFDSAILFLDTGILWAKEAIFNGSLIVPPATVTETNVETIISNAEVIVPAAE